MADPEPQNPVGAVKADPLPEPAGAAAADPLPVIPAGGAAAADPLPVIPAGEAAAADPLPVIPAGEPAAADPLPVIPAGEAAAADPLPVIPAGEATAADPVLVIQAGAAAADPLPVNPAEAAAPGPLPLNPAGAATAGLPKEPVRTSEPQSGLEHVKQKIFPPRRAGRISRPVDLNVVQPHRPVSPIDAKMKPAESGTLKTPKPIPPRNGTTGSNAPPQIPESPASIRLRNLCSDFLEFKRTRLTWQRSMEHEMKTIFPKMDQLLKSLEVLSKRISSIPSTVPTDENQLRCENDRLNYLIISSAGIFKHIDDMMGPLKEKAEEFTEITTGANLGIDERLKKIISAICERATPLPSSLSTAPPRPPPPSGPGSGPGAPPAPPAPGSGPSAPPAPGSDPSAPPAPPAPSSGADGSASGSAAGAPSAPSAPAPTKPVTEEEVAAAVTEAMTRMTALTSASDQALDASVPTGGLTEGYNLQSFPKASPSAKVPEMVPPYDVGYSIIGSKIISSVAPEKESKAGVSTHDKVVPPDQEVEETDEGRIQPGQDAPAMVGTPELSDDESVAADVEPAVEASKLIGTSETGVDASVAASTPDVEPAVEASKLVGTPETGEDASVVAGTPDVEPGVEASKLVGTPDIGEDASVVAGTPDVEPGVEASQLVGTPESGIEPCAEGAKVEEKDYKTYAKLFP